MYINIIDTIEEHLYIDVIWKKTFVGKESLYSRRESVVASFFYIARFPARLARQNRDWKIHLWKVCR